MAKKKTDIDANAQARESETLSREEKETQLQEHDRQIAAAIGTRNQEQVDRRNAIANRADEQEDRQTIDFDGDKLIEDDPTEAAAARAEAEAEEERQRLETEANERAAREDQEAGAVRAEPKKYRLKVNGKEVELTEEEVLERAQKVESADEYLQTAKKAVEASLARGPSQDGPASHEEDVTEDTLTSALQGDPEAIRKIAQRLKAPSTVTPDVLTAVDDRMSFRDAVNWFRGEYKDIVSDPMAYQLVVAEDTRLARDEPSLGYQARLKKAGDKVKGWLSEKTKSATPPNPKLERKASVLPIPQAGGRQVVREEDEEEEPVESVIDKMARARHQGGAVRHLPTAIVRKQ